MTQKILGKKPPANTPIPYLLAYQPPANNTFLSDQTSHQQPVSSTFLSEQTQHQPSGTSQTNRPQANQSTAKVQWEQ
jgi:hypothetical protein